MEQLENIRKNADLVVKVFAENNNVSLDFDAESVEWLDGYIERHRENFDEETIKKLTGVFGSFLGECICRNFGGVWTEDEYGFAVKFADGNGAYPFNKIEKQFRNGSDDSISSFYQTIPIIFNLSQ
jgi:hypothetical protein